MNIYEFILLVAFSLILIWFETNPVLGACLMSYCEKEAAVSTRSYITNPSRQIVGDVYNPGHGKRLQIRDNHRRIIGYIKTNGQITSTRHQKTGAVK